MVTRFQDLHNFAMLGEIGKRDIGPAKPDALFGDRVGTNRKRHCAPDKLRTVEVVLTLQTVSAVERHFVLRGLFAPADKFCALVRRDVEAENANRVDVAQECRKRYRPDLADFVTGGCAYPSSARIRMHDLSFIVCFGAFSRDNDANMAPAPVTIIGPFCGKLCPEGGIGTLEDKVTRHERGAHLCRKVRASSRAIGAGIPSSNDPEGRQAQYFEKHVFTELEEGTEISALAASSPLESVSPVRIAREMAFASAIGIGSPV